MLEQGAESLQSGHSKSDGDEVRIDAPECTQRDSSMPLDDDQKPPDVAMAADHTEDSIKDEPHRLESGADQLGARMISSSVPPTIDDPEVDWCDSQQGSPTMPDIPMFGGGSISDQPAMELSWDVEAPDDQKVAAAVPA